MSVDRDTASRYRQHAHELRAAAAGARSVITRKTLMSIAADYECLARSLDAGDPLEAESRPIERKN